MVVSIIIVVVKTIKTIKTIAIGCSASTSTSERLLVAWCWKFLVADWFVGCAVATVVVVTVMESFYLVSCCCC